MDTTRQRLLATTLRFVMTLESLDVDAMLAVRSSTCLHHMCCPSFRNYSITNDQTREAFPQWKSTITKYKFGILAIFHASSKFNLLDFLVREGIPCDILQIVSFNWFRHSRTYGLWLCTRYGLLRALAGSTEYLYSGVPLKLHFKRLQTTVTF